MEARIGFRVHLISHDKNEGIEVALNSGLSYIFTSLDAKYIARLDCGDYNVQNRFDRQYEFMEANTDVCLVGSWADVSENNRPLYTIRTPSTHHEIQKRMLINNCFIHPTVMFRTAAAREVGLYPRGFPAAEDYAYFFLFVKRFISANIPEVLVHLPKYDEGISRKRRKTQLISRIRINLHNFRLDWNSVRGLLTNSFLLVVPIGIIEYLKMAHDRASHH